MKRFFLILLLIIILFLFLSVRTLAQANKIDPILDKYIEAWNTGNVELLQGIIDPAFELRQNPDFKPQIGIEELTKELISIRDIMPDFQITGIEKKYLGDDAVALLWTVKGTYKGKSDKTTHGNKMEIPGFSIIYFNGEILTGEWIAISDLKWASQAGYKITEPQ